MISVEEAQERMLATIQPLPAITVALAEAAGLVLAEDVIAKEDLPPFANSAMDGYALRSADTRMEHGRPARLRVIGTIAAGYVTEQAIEPGTAMRIMTGAPVPRGADAVIQIELTRSDPTDSSWVEILQEVAPGNNIRAAGEDIRRGQRVLSQGSEIGPWEIGVLATVGQARVKVIRRPRVAIVSTGDEIIDVGEPLQPGKIRNSNGYLLEAAVRRAGAEALRLGVARDTEESLRQVFSQAMQHDLIITSGGVSVGEFDLVKRIMNEQGVIDFWQINMRPGKPLAFGRIGQVPLLGLPGNPVSAAVTFELFGRPLIRKLLGHRRLHRPQVEVTVEDGVSERTPRRHYVRAQVRREQGRFVARTTGHQGSHITTSLLNANALVIVPEGGKILKPGETAQAIMLDWPEE
ncbi:MAG: molybdopterin molybdotransferase MoeA [Thermogemmatispora sp.]|uniref:Molybdopterin molybdenumtransferase n=1 Tax=Thermogemmatispora aurantia TaxID=2045279 RepID=A0A5J4K4I2_9CHLR|nr:MULTISPECIES: gephyrin-like molybdotransferase Glp [Thermogemmatispora]MBE3565583.1 molybdopterin molybdotransferase MoeA [Thermogemmatispora sp.]GER81972.1 molybdopterin molybdenumtransferase MoeA [Thermogemmatispora aurantia]